MGILKLKRPSEENNGENGRILFPPLSALYYAVLECSAAIKPVDTGKFSINLP